MWAETVGKCVVHTNCTWFAKRDVPQQKGIKSEGEQWIWYMMRILLITNSCRPVNESIWKKEKLKGLTRESPYNN